MEPSLSVAVHAVEGLQEGNGEGVGFYGDVALPVGAAGSWSMLLSFSSQYMAFFEFNNRLEAILSKAYIYR